jgi:hypothetical protein
MHLANISAMFPSKTWTDSVNGFGRVKWKLDSFGSWWGRAVLEWIWELERNVRCRSSEEESQPRLLVWLSRSETAAAFSFVTRAFPPIWPSGRGQVAPSPEHRNWHSQPIRCDSDKWITFPFAAAKCLPWRSKLNRSFNCLPFP